MISIPFTKIKVSWQMLALLMIISSSWQRGLLAFAMLVGGMAVISLVLWIPVTWLLYSKHRRPGENLWQLSARMEQETSQRQASRYLLRKHCGRGQVTDSYLYLVLDCGHVVFEYFTEAPQIGDKFWCWGHRKHGPAQEQTIVNVHRWLPDNVNEKVLM